MDLVIAFVAGMFAMPWMWLSLCFLLVFSEVLFSHREDFALATLITFVGVVIVAYFGADLNVFIWAWHHPGTILQFSVIYLAIGGLWSVAKWYRYRLKERDDLLKIIDRWSRKREANIVTVEASREPGHKPGNRGASWDQMNPRPKRNRLNTASDNMDLLMGWVAHWPFSMVATLIGDFLVRAVEHVVKALSGVYDRIDEHIFKGVDEEESE
jgi:hypothetical protein